MGGEIGEEVEMHGEEGEEGEAIGNKPSKYSSIYQKLMKLHRN